MPDFIHDHKDVRAQWALGLQTSHSSLLLYTVFPYVYLLASLLKSQGGEAYLRDLLFNSPLDLLSAFVQRIHVVHFQTK